MKCPKCSYIGFEAIDRCRNCGYEFSLAGEPVAEPELTIATGDEPGPLADLAIRDDTAVAPARRTPARALDLDRVIGAPEPPPSQGTSSSPDLPLFAPARGASVPTPVQGATSWMRAGPGDPVARPPVPPTPRLPTHDPGATRRPFGGRRPTDDLVRPRPRSRESARVQTATLDLPLPPPADEPPPAEPFAAMPRVGQEILGPAPFAERAAAAAIDLVILGGIDLVTVWLTLRLVGLSFADWLALPLLPLGAFFLVLNGGYLALFTAASGQTIGKMAIGLKVVAGDTGPVPLDQASVRALAAMASTVCLGAGFWPAAADADGRALYDRLAQTRVVRIGT